MFWFVWANLTLIGCIWHGLPWIQVDGGPWMRALCAIFAAMGVIIGTTLAAGVCGVLRPEVLALAPTVLLFASVVASRIWPQPAREPWLVLPEDPWGATGAVLLTTSLGTWFAGPGWSGTRFIYDDITYHAAVPAIWTQWQTIEYTNLTYQAYYPFDAELLGLWFVVPLRHFGHAGLAVMLVITLLVTAFGALAERQQVHTGAWTTLLAALVISPRVLYFARTYSANDLAMSAFLLAMLAFTLAPPSLRTALWAGLAAGAAVGTKVSAAPIVALVALVWLVRSRQDARWFAGFLAATVPLGAYWYIHNLAQTGNPLFPAQLGPFEGPLDKQSQGRTTIAWFIANRSKNLGFWRVLFRSRLDWPVFLGVTAITGYVFAFADVVDRRRRPGVWLLFAAGLIFLALHPLQPFSGTINRPASPLHEMFRYIAFPIVIGLFLVASSVRSSRWMTLLGAAAWFQITAAQWKSFDPTQLRAIGFSALLALVVVTFRVQPLRRGGVLALAVLALIAVRTEPKRQATVNNSRTFTRHGTYHSRAWAALDKLPDGSAIAWISDLPPSHSFNLPNLGSRLQHRLVPLDFDGKRYTEPLHTRWRKTHEKWWSDFKRKHKKEVPVLENVLDSGADYLVISRCQQSKKGGWPAPHGALNRMPTRNRVYAGRCAEVWKLGPLKKLRLLEPVRRKKPPEHKP